MLPLVTAAEAAAEAVATTRNARQQHEDRGDDADDRGKPEGDADGPYERCEQDRDEYADHFGTPLLFLPDKSSCPAPIVPLSQRVEALPVGCLRNLALTGDGP